MNNCDHKQATIRSTIDTIFACYVEWKCECGADGVVKITREMYDDIRRRYNEE